MRVAVLTDRPARRRISLVIASLISLAFLGNFALTAQSRATDPAVEFMDRVARELLAASRSKSPEMVAAVVHRYADVGYIGNFALGSYRGQLNPGDRQTYLNGMVKFIGRYTANEAPKYPIARYEILSSAQGPSGVMVDSRITLRDGATYDVRWLLSRYGSTYRVRDAMVYGFWMSPFLKKLFENHIADNGGNVRALVTTLSR